jgi:hypothetical protein
MRDELVACYCRQCRQSNGLLVADVMPRAVDARLAKSHTRRVEISRAYFAYIITYIILNMVFLISLTSVIIDDPRDYAYFLERGKIMDG